MKRKLITIFVLLLTMAICFSAQAQTLSMPLQGVTLAIPDDFTVSMDDQQDSVHTLAYESASHPDTYFMITAGGAELQASQNMTDMTSAQRDELFAQYSQDWLEPSYKAETLGNTTYMILTDSTHSMEMYLTIVSGRYVELMAYSLTGGAISDATVNALNAIASSIEIQ